jgi:hypothetical protein
VDDIGEVAAKWAGAVGAKLTSGAVALLVTADKMTTAVARVARVRTSLGPSASPPALREVRAGHEALLPLAGASVPTELACASFLLGTVAHARVELVAL